MSYSDAEMSVACLNPNNNNLTCDDAYFSYGYAKSWRADCVFEGGSTYQLLGENASGKSTIGKLVTGIELPKTGQIYLDTTPLADMTPIQKRDKFLFVPQEPQWMFFAKSLCDSLKRMQKGAALCRADEKYSDLVDVVPDQLLSKIRRPVLELSTEEVFLLALLELKVWERPVVFIDEYPDFEDVAISRFVRALLKHREKSNYVTIIARHVPTEFEGINYKEVIMSDMVEESI